MNRVAPSLRSIQYTDTYVSKTYEVTFFPLLDVIEGIFIVHGRSGVKVILIFLKVAKLYL